MSIPGNPWLSVPLSDYEGHMGPGGVQQLQALSDLFARVLAFCQPESVTILGIAGGNGLERIDPLVTKRVAGVDINAAYLDEVRGRFGATVAGLDLFCADLGDAAGASLPRPSALVHAALVFEHTGLERCLDRALLLVDPRGGRFSVVLQLPSTIQAGVAKTGFASIGLLEDRFQLIDAASLQRLLRDEKGFLLEFEELRPLPAGKALWLGIFTRLFR